jgi:hypothetical protein
MEFMRLVAASNPEQCREMGELLLGMADIPRDATWHANIETAIAKFETPEDRSLMATIGRSRRRVAQVSDAMAADGMDHQTLAEAELRRRGDGRTFAEYRQAITADSVVSEG